MPGSRSRGKVGSRREEPEKLQALYEYAATQEGWFCGYFEMTPLHPSPWWTDDGEAAALFPTFAYGGSGSTYAFWLHGGLDLAGAPVVYLERQAAWCGVIADEFDDFLALLAVGEEEVGLSVAFRGFQGPAEGYLAELREFQRWLKSQYNIVPAPNPEELVARAQKKHPDLDAWITDRLKETKGW
jgi:hypothetical protein